MRVRKIDTEQKKDVQQFVNFPFDLYRECPLWVPPLISGVKNSLNRHRHPFYRHSTADFFVAERNGQTLGRMAVINNRNYSEYRQTKTAFFGYFDVVEDVKVSQALFTASFEWAQAQGLDEIIGPRGILASEGGGILVEGFEHRPAMGVAYNYPYYDNLIKSSCFEKDTDYLSGYVRGDYELSERFFKLAEKAKVRRGFWIKEFSRKQEMREWVPRVVKAHRKAFEQTHTFFPPTDEETAMIIDTLLTVAEPELIKLVMKDDEIVGFVGAFRDISVGLQKAGGRIWPFGWYHLLRERKRTEWLNVNGLGLLPEYRGLGANTIIYTELQKVLRTHKFKHLDLVQIEEGNLKSMAEMKAIGGIEWYKRHRSYRRRL
jgi:hypothetical protein